MAPLPKVLVRATRIRYDGYQEHFKQHQQQNFNDDPTRLLRVLGTCGPECKEAEIRRTAY